jgi:hypothetical protein
MKLIIITFCLLLFGCKQKESNDSYDLDLSIKYKSSLNSFKIDEKGNAVVLINEMGQEPRLYNVVYGASEMKYIYESLRNVNFTKCDSIKNHYVDGTNYIMILKSRNTQKINVIVSDNCEQQKSVDKLIFYIAQTFKKKKGDEFFKSINGLVFVKPDIPPAGASIR